MPENNRAYFIGLYYDTLYCKTIKVTAPTLFEACRYAMDHADDDDNWTDTCLVSPHWVGDVDGDTNSVPQEFTEAAVRAGGAVLIANRLRTALRSLVEACEGDPQAWGRIGDRIEEATAILETVPDEILIE